MSIDYRDYYAVLGVKKDAPAEEIKYAYRRLAKKHHPDLHPEQDKAKATNTFKVINEAYEVLSDPQKKSKYDQIGPDWRPREESGPPTSGGKAPHEFRRGEGENSFDGFSSFFESLFGGEGGPEFARGQPARQGARKGPDVEAELPLSLEDSVLGGDKNLSLKAAIACPFCRRTGRQGNRFCPNCAGVGETRQDRTITVHLPKGTRDGMKLRLRGQGGSSTSGEEPGDLFLRIRLLPHLHHKVVGSDLETSVIVMPWEASLGGEVSVPALEGPIRIRIPAGTHSGQRLRIAGKGLAKEDGPRGDLYALVQIDIPDKTSDEIKRLYQELRKAGS